MRLRKVYAIIPARGGSKGVPKKNIRLLAGHPLIAYSIVAARRCRRIDSVIVSTDSQELAQDRSADIDFIRHALDWFEEHDHVEPEMLVHLRPTTLRASPGLP